MRGSLDKHLAAPALTDAEIRRLRAAAWHAQRVLVVKLDEIHDEWLRQAMVNLGTKLYGKTAGR